VSHGRAQLTHSIHLNNVCDSLRLHFGPVGLPVVEYARCQCRGKVVGWRDPVGLRDAMRELMDAAALREELRRITSRLAAERNDAAAVSEEKRRILTAETGNRR